MRGRTAFTLVEMVVVLAIVLLLSALAVALAPRMGEQQKTARAAEQVQGSISLARQWARRARVPTGIRLLPGRLLPNPVTPNPRYVTEMQFIQQPPDFVVNPGLTPDVPPNVRRVQVLANNLNTVLLEPAPGAVITPRPNDFSGGFPITQKDAWPVQPGDYFQANGGGLMHRIQTVEATSLTLGTDATHPSPLPLPVNYTKEYRIVRKPRILPGEAALQIGQDVAIDLTKSQIPALNQDGSVDIVFAPSGAISAVGTVDKVILWLRDITKDDVRDVTKENPVGNQILIAIYVRTGLVAAFDVAPPPDPYLFTRDGRSSGL